MAYDLLPVPRPLGHTAGDLLQNQLTAWENFKKIRRDSVYSAQSFGAKGDGITDDTAAILRAAQTAGRRTVFFPPGQYKCVGLDLSSYPCTFKGDQSGGSVIELHSNTSDMITIAPASESIGWKFSDLQFSSFFKYRFATNPGFVPSDVGKQVLGASSGQTGKLVNYDNSDKSAYIAGGPVYTIGETVSVVLGTGTSTITANMNTLHRAFKLTRVAQSQWENCIFDGFYAGLDFFQDCSTSEVVNCTFGSMNQYGLRFSSSGTTTNISMTGGFFNENLNRSLYLNSSWCKFTGVKFESASEGHVLIDSAAEHNQFTGCHFRAGGGPVTPLAVDIYGNYNVFNGCQFDQHSGTHEVIVRAGATGNAFILNQTARSSFVNDSGTATQYLLFMGNRFSVGLRTDDGACGIQAQGPGRLNRPVSTEGKNAGWLLADHTGVPKVALAMEGTASNDLQLMAAHAMRFYTGSDLVNTGEVGRWLANGGLLIGKTTDDGAKLQVSGRISRGVTASITASTTQSQGQGALTQDVNFVSVCANANDTVTLPAAAAGQTCYIRNNGAQVLQIFPALGDAINGAAVNSSTTLAAGASVRYEAADGTNWYS